MHSAVAEQLGLSVAERQRAQRFQAEDPKLAAALELAGQVVETRGHPSDEALDRVREAGYSDAEIMEMVAHVALTTFSNYVNETAQTEVDIPQVHPVHTS